MNIYIPSYTTTATGGGYFEVNNMKGYEKLEAQGTYEEGGTPLTNYLISLLHLLRFHCPTIREILQKTASATILSPTSKSPIQTKDGQKTEESKEE